MKKLNSFKIVHNNVGFYFYCEKAEDKDKWIGVVSKQMVARNGQSKAKVSEEEESSGSEEYR